MTLQKATYTRKLGPMMKGEIVIMMISMMMMMKKIFTVLLCDKLCDSQKEINDLDVIMK